LRLKRSLAWVVTAQASSFVLQFGASVVLARLLTPYEMGIFAVAVAIAGALALLQSFGLQNLIVRAEELTEDMATTAFSLNAILALILSVAIAGVSVLGGRFLNDDGVRNVLLVIAATPAIALFEFRPAANLERRGRFKAISIINTLRACVMAGTTVYFAVLGHKYMSLAYGQVAAAVAGALMMNWAGREFVSFRLGFRDFRRTALFGSQMLAIQGVTHIAGRASDIAMAKLLGLAPLGLYGRASGLNSLIWDKIHLALGRVMFVDFASHVRQGISLRPRYLRTVEMMTALLWPAFAGLAVLAEPFIVAVYGERWAPAAAPLVFLAMASVIQVSITMTWEVFVACGEIRTQTRIEFIRAASGLVLFIGGCLIGLTAAAAARTLDAVVAVLIYRKHLMRMTETRISDYAGIYARSALLTVLAIAPSAVLMLAHVGPVRPPVGLAGAAVAAGMLLWVAGLVVLRHPLLAEVRASFRRGGPTTPALAADDPIERGE
jgi:O-antigen/teichoic acid export membrane protein